MDEQTYADLNVHQTNRDSFSLYGLFKKTKTIGARERLEHIFHTPTNDTEKLKLRSEAISFLMNSPIDLDIDHTQFDLILHYLKFDKRFLRANLIDSVAAFVGNHLKESPSYYTILIGIKQLLRLFAYSKVLSIELQDSKSDYLVDLGKRLQLILELPELAYVIKLSSRRKIRFYEFGKLDQFIRRKAKLQVIDLLHIFYELDVLEAAANAAIKEHLCIAEYRNQESLAIDIEGLFYPGINNAVRNNIQLNSDQHCIFLTGSNMAGKSSFLRSLATSIYLAHLGFPVPAKYMRSTVLNGLITTINLGDDVNTGLSHYLNEVSRVKQIAEVLTQRDRMLILHDELFRGTNPDDAHTASGVVIKGFAEIKHSAFIVSSHLSKLASELSDSSTSFKHMEHVMDHDGLKFTYKLQDGISTEGIGMYFIQQANIAETLLKAKGLT